MAREREKRESAKGSFQSQFTKLGRRLLLLSISPSFSHSVDLFSILQSLIYIFYSHAFVYKSSQFTLSSI